MEAMDTWVRDGSKGVHVESVSGKGEEMAEARTLDR